MLLTKPFFDTYTMPSTPTVSASRILMAALRFRIRMLSHTGWAAIHVTIQMKASWITSDHTGSMRPPKITSSSSGHTTARDAIHSGKLIQ